MPFHLENVGDFVRCPDCHAELVQDGDHLVCTNPDKRTSYPIKDGIPVLLPDEGTQLSEADWKAVMQKAGRTVA